MINVDFGDRVNITGKLVRKITRGTERGLFKSWVTVPAASSGIFLGTRVLQNGIREYDGEYGYTFNPKERFKAALVCEGKDSNPIYVALDCIEVKHKDG